ncbi:hypothetical protein AUJ42_01175 [Candidatus Collierbacteria bacterium CG1_02_44_10]|uniref:nicotinate phosphoribosyltransferase n=4 Tax=Candidatus Collieribacteriota TaxID=1752725 RepID=A0A2H0DVT1_9BACT|nr:hypothetical protein [bacterium]OIN91878.1 MAG: hypothetical protein AUJ42_01175 [Candidatus Collierbacteria bacterium CG1_02_44_10]PIP85958.1 MAG: hypothetical protein COW83_01515 [Candidatus Collierbacteria bacterium CG22_combo_CG10-13_8_21_14_all_43_12]PIR99598.1 MAG: hypothetical protein COT86_03095 [Candidatus Collierbacteria bacterium CG10_big_fil_rev_8_21_14_0_10_43_36]PIZ24822.1 MAG: hypothetical protein COY48_00895 [Candidatus Collierbacteria bacterium CG_4_10_14_0_8_um_filter_43_86
MAHRSSGNEIIRDILENDVYDDSMCNGFRTLYPKAWGYYEFNDRDKTIYPPGYAGLLTEKVQDLKLVGSDPNKMEFFRNAWHFIPKSYFDWREKYRYNPELVKFWQDNEGQLHGSVIGSIEMGIFFETVLLAINSQTFNEENEWLPDDDWHEVLYQGIDRMKEAGLQVAEFGMRRRAYNWMHDEANEILYKRGGSFKSGGVYVGASVPYHSYFSGLAPKGTVAHQWPMFHAAIFGIEWANQTANAAWRAVYGENVATALMDTFTDEFFWATLTPEMAHLFKSFRFDSGVAKRQISLANCFLTHPSVDVDPATVTLMPTDSLDAHKAIKLSRQIRNLGYKDAFGIGGYFTNNKEFFKKTPAYRPLRTVIKLVAVSLNEGDTWLKTAKVSNTPGKYTGDPKKIAEYLHHIQQHPFPFPFSG